MGSPNNNPQAPGTCLRPGGFCAEGKEAAFCRTLAVFM